MTVPFNQVPDSYRASKIFIELAGVSRSLASLFIPPTVALVGMYDPLKTATVDYVPVRVVSSDDVGDKAGFGSHAHRQALRIPSAVYLQGGGVWWFPIPEESGGSAGEETITLTGTTASSAGTLYFSIGGVNIQIGVASGDAIADIATAIATAITAELSIAVTAVPVAGVITVTAKFKGTAGNQILIKQNPAGETQEADAPGGITVALEFSDGYLAAGATDPDLEDMFFDSGGNDILGDRWYTQMTMPFNDATNIAHYKLSTTKRSNADTNRLYVAYTAYIKETYSAALAIPATINAKFISPAWDLRAEYPAFEIAAEIAGIVADEENKAPNRPYKTLALSGPADGTIDNLRDTEYDALFRAGMSYLKISTDGTLRLGDIALSYRTNPSSAPTTEWFAAVDAHNRQAKAYSIENAFLTEQYERSVVQADGDPPTAVNFSVKPSDVVAELTKLVEDLWATFAWSKNINQIIEDISANINLSNDERIDGEVIDDQAKALRIIAVRYAYLF